MLAVDSCQDQNYFVKCHECSLLCSWCLLNCPDCCDQNLCRENRFLLLPSELVNMLEEVLLSVKLRINRCRTIIICFLSVRIFKSIINILHGIIIGWRRAIRPAAGFCCYYVNHLKYMYIIYMLNYHHEAYIRRSSTLASPTPESIGTQSSETALGTSSSQEDNEDCHQAIDNQLQSLLHTNLTLMMVL